MGSVAASGIGAIVSGLGNVSGEAIDASDAIDKFNSTMGFAGFGKEKIQSTSKEVQKYANDTVYELGDVSNTTAQLAANGIKDYMGITEAAGNLNAVAGGNADTFKSVAMMLTQTAGAGKLITENWNQLADAIPGASGQLQAAMKKNGAYTGNFRDAMADGKISSDEFSKAITQLGMQDGAVKAAKSTKTFEGAVGNLEAAVVTDIQEVIGIIGKGTITGSINRVTDAVSGFQGYLKSHRSTLSDIFGDLKEILGTIGSTVWKTFSGIVYNIANFFGLISDKAKKSKDPIDQIDSALSNLAKNKELIEDLTKAFIAMFALKKGYEFIKMLSEVRKALMETAAISKITDLLGGGSVNIGKTATQATEQTVTKEVGETAATTGGSKALGKIFSKGGATTTAELEAASGVGGSKLLSGVSGLAKATPYLGLLASVPELFGTTKKTLGKHVGGFTGSAGGAAAGAAVGSFAGPVGTIVGGAVGGIAGSKLGQSIGDDIQKGVTKNFPKLTAQASDLAHDMSNKFSGGFKPSINDKQFSKTYTSLSSSLNKQATLKIKTDTSSIKKAKSETDSTYDKMGKSVDKYYGHKRQASTKDYATLVQNRTMTEKEANKSLNKAKENYTKQSESQKKSIAKMKGDSDSYYKTLGTLESKKNKALDAARKADGKNHDKYLKDKKKIEDQYESKTSAARKQYLSKLSKDEAKSNDAVTKATKISSGKQLDILENLKDHKGKISKQQMTDTIKSSLKERDETIKNAGKTRDKSVDSANKKYKETIAAADKERYENGTMSRKQYDEVVKNARDQRDKSIDAADTQKKKTIKHAEDTHEKVVDEATKQAGEHKGAVDSETGEVINSWG